MDNYESITKLGKGSCGAVYLVRHKPTKKLLALKQITLDESSKNRKRETVEKEAKILSELKHPNIVAFHESFFDDEKDILCITLDYCDGGTLEDRINEAKRKHEYFAEKLILQWFIQIAMAVQYMHSTKVLHRDLKTANVFIMKHGDKIKIGDFGISKMMDTTIDAASTCVGTPIYLSPEMCQDIPYTSKADIWALGCLLYEMCALRPPFDANNLISLFYKIVKGEFDAIPSQYSGRMSDVVKAILVKVPEDRPSAKQVLNLPYVSEVLSEFIEEKEYQLQMKALRKDTPSKLNPDLQKIRVNGKKESPKVQRKNIKVHQDPREEPVKSIEASASVPSEEITSEKLECSECGKLFRMKSWLQKHINQKHSDNISNSNSDPTTVSEAARTVHEEPNLETDLLETFRYQDDFEIEGPPSDSDSEDACNDQRNEIPEELPGGEVAEDNSDLDEVEDECLYDDDDFEDYNSDEELDAIINHGRVLQDTNSDDETIVDEFSSEVIQGCKNYVKEHCRKAFKMGPNIDFGRITEEDLRPQFELMKNGIHMETCYLMSEILTDNK